MNVVEGTPKLLMSAVVYATDFSKCSENAGRYASLLARQFDAELAVAHAFELSQAAMEAEAKGGPSARSSLRKDLESALKAVAERLADGMKRVVPILLEGDPKKQIPALARAKEPSFIVLGTQGRSRIGRGLLGSVAEEILRSAASPTLTVGPQVPTPERESMPFRRILYATGLSPAAAHTAQHAVAVARASGAEMRVLHVIHREDVEDAERMLEIRRQFDAMIEKQVPSAASEIQNPICVVEVGNAHEQILHHLREYCADLLVLGVRKTSHLWLESRRSGAFQIIAESPCPVMTIVR